MVNTHWETTLIHAAEKKDCLISLKRGHTYLFTKHRIRANLPPGCFNGWWCGGWGRQHSWTPATPVREARTGELHESQGVVRKAQRQSRIGALPFYEAEARATNFYRIFRYIFGSLPRMLKGSRGPPVRKVR